MTTPIDLSLCEKEPIHAPGSIQNHGCLVVCDPSSNRITWVSNNSECIIGISASVLLGQPTDRLAPFGIDELPNIPEGCDPLCQSVTIDSRLWDLWIHRHHGLIFCEWEPHTAASDTPSNQPPGPWTQALGEEQAPTIYRAADLVAQEFALVSGYDRVMIYRFLPDWSGEVIAEVRCDDSLLPYLGLRYPASDIPAQARQLYILNRYRIISDVHGQHVPIIGLPKTHPLDCSLCRLRSTSPYHLEYLQNMGVSASIACSLVLADQSHHDGTPLLWGMVVGHHRNPKRLDSTTEQRLQNLCVQWSSWISAQQHCEQEQRTLARDRDRQRMATILDGKKQDPVLRQLIVGDLVLPRIFRSSGAALLIDQGMIRMGDCPSPAGLTALGKMIQQKVGSCGVWHCNQLDDEAQALIDTPTICGILAGVCTTQSSVILLCFRSEVTHDVFWGGDPATPAEVDSQQRLRPRKSFDLWRETVRGQAEPWEDALLDRMDDLVHLLEPHTHNAQPVGREEGMGSNEAHKKSHLLSQMRRLLTFDSQGIEVLDLALRGSRDGVLILSDHQNKQRSSNAAANGPQVVYANAVLFETFGADPLTTHLDELQGLIMASGINPTALTSGAQSVDAWTKQRGHRRLLCDSSHALSVHHGNSQRTWYALHIRDVTLDHRVMQAMTAARDQARQAQHAQKSLLANVSHEMRTPLNAIIGFSDLLTEDDIWKDPEQRSEFLGYIQEGGKFLLHLISNILDIAALQGGRIALGTDEVINLPELLSEVEHWLQSYATQHEVRIQASSTTYARAHIMGDRQRLRQVLINVIANGIKYNRSNGLVRWNIEIDPSDDVLITITDTGIGIASQDLAQIFDPFGRVLNEQTQGREGTGLGLSISRALVELHGGTLTAHSEIGRGTTMIIRIPSYRRHLPTTADSLLTP